MASRLLYFSTSDSGTLFFACFRALMRAAADSSILRSCGQLSSACMIASKCLVVSPIGCEVDDGVSYGDGVSSPWSVDVGVCLTQGQVYVRP